MAKKKTIKLLDPKKALRNVSVYEKNRKKQKEPRSKVVENFRDNISKYLNKDGSLSKTKLRTKKARREYNKLVRDFNKSVYSTYKGRRDVEHKATETAIKENTYTRKESKKVREAFAEDIYHYMLQKGALTSSQMINLATDYMYSDESNEILFRVLEEIKKRIEFEVPDELRDDLTLDDIYTVTDKIMNEYFTTNKTLTEILDTELTDEKIQTMYHIEG